MTTTPREEFIIWKNAMLDLVQRKMLKNILKIGIRINSSDEALSILDIKILNKLMKSFNKKKAELSGNRLRDFFVFGITILGSIGLIAIIANNYSSYAQLLQPSIPPSGTEITPPTTISPELKSKICDPNDTHVNTTESKICGIPKTPSAPAAPTTTTGPPKPISPSSPGSITPPSETAPTPQGPIPGLLP